MVSRRSLLGAPLWAAVGMNAVAQARAGQDSQAPTAADQFPIASGPFQPSVESLKTYQTPAWFRDAKFGIWAHWGPQAVPRSGDWYARFMYVPGHPHYAHHVKHYGHPSEFGYKDIIPLWKAEKFDPEALMDRYVAAGAKYFVSMGVHHDNFDLWNSRHHRWNAVAMGPKRDIVGAWRDAARRADLPLIHVRHDSVQPGSPFRPGQPGHLLGEADAARDGQVIGAAVERPLTDGDLPAARAAVRRRPHGTARR